MKHLLILIIFLVAGCNGKTGEKEQQDSRADRVRYVCKEVEFELEVSEWEEARKIMHKVAIDHDRTFIDLSEVKPLHPILAARITLGFHPTIPPNYYFVLSSNSFMRKKEKVKFSQLVDNVGACNTEESLYQDAVTAFSKRWNITKISTPRKI